MTTPRAIPAPEIPRLLAACREGRDRLAVRMSLLTGLRAHELLALDVGDLTYPDGSVRESIRLHTWKGQGDATEDAAQVVYLSATLRAEIAAYLTDHITVGPMFCSRAPTGPGRSVPYARRLERHALGSILHAACRASGIGPYRWHDLRHTFCTTLVEHGVDLRTVQALARHRSIETTVIYTHPSAGHCAAAVESL